MTFTVLDSIATGNPPLRRSQEQAAEFMQQIEGIPERVQQRLPGIYERSGIDYRFSAIEDYGRRVEDFTFYPSNWSLSPAPSTAERNTKYREAVLPLAERVAREAIEQADMKPEEITHVIGVSCTGFFAPGLDIELVKRLGLPPSTQRTMIGFMGCYAAFNALRVGHNFCQANPDARVLLVCAELCTLHFQVNNSLESAVVNAIFSDGAAAAILSARSRREAAGRLAYATGHTHLDDNSMDHMTWDLGDTGFQMGLSAAVPRVIARQLPGYVRALLEPQDLRREDVDFWAIHPGGRAIVEEVQSVLDLPEEAVWDSFEVLRRYGNMSSPTILFVMKRFLDRHRQARGEVESERESGKPREYETGVAMAFGPGLTLEGCLFRQVP